MAINQAHLFLIFTINGVFIGLIFDFFRILRQGFKTSNLITYIEDILFWIISGFSIIYTMVNFSNGALRFYMIMGLLIGFITYILTCSKYIRKYSVAIIIFSKKISKFIWNIFTYPLKRIYKIIIIPLNNIVKKEYLSVKKLFFSTINIKIFDRLSLNNKKIKKRKKSVKKRGIFLRKVEK